MILNALSRRGHTHIRSSRAREWDERSRASLVLFIAEGLELN